jgi:hypothetical protein
VPYVVLPDAKPRVEQLSQAWARPKSRRRQRNLRELHQLAEQTIVVRHQQSALDTRLRRQPVRSSTGN